MIKHEGADKVYEYYYNSIFGGSNWEFEKSQAAKWDAITELTKAQWRVLEEYMVKKGYTLKFNDSDENVWLEKIET